MTPGGCKQHLVIKSSLKVRCFSVMRYETIMTENQKLKFIMGPREFKELVEIKCSK